MVRVRLRAESTDGTVRNDMRPAEHLPLRLVKHVEMIVTQEVGSIWRLELAIDNEQMLLLDEAVPATRFDRRRRCLSDLVQRLSTLRRFTVHEVAFLALPAGSDKVDACNAVASSAGATKRISSYYAN